MPSSYSFSSRVLVAGAWWRLVYLLQRSQHDKYKHISFYPRYHFSSLLNVSLTRFLFQQFDQQVQYFCTRTEAIRKQKQLLSPRWRYDVRHSISAGCCYDRDDYFSLYKRVDNDNKLQLSKE